MTLQHSLEIMQAELESHQLQVCLAPSRRHDRRDWDMIRVCMDKNPTWYSHFCARHHSTRIRVHRKLDTCIKRANTLRALQQMIDGVPAGKYENELRFIAQTKAA